MLKHVSLFILFTSVVSLALAKTDKPSSKESLEESLSQLTPKVSREIDQGAGEETRKIVFHRLSKRDAELPVQQQQRKERRRLAREAGAARSLDAASTFIYPKRPSFTLMTANELASGEHFLEWRDSSTGQSLTALSNLDFGSLNPAITLETATTRDTWLLFHFPYWENYPMQARSDAILDALPRVHLSKRRSEFAVVEGSAAAEDMDSVMALDALHVAADEAPETVEREPDSKTSAVQQAPKKKEDVTLYFWPIQSEKHKD